MCLGGSPFFEEASNLQSSNTNIASTIPLKYFVYSSSKIFVLLFIMKI